jgi:kumamolisin
VLCQPRIRFPRAAGASYAPAQLAALYHCPKVKPAIPGKPFVIGIISLGGGHKRADAAAALARQGLPAPVIVDVSVQGATNRPGDPADVENAMDIQISASWYSFCTGEPALVRFYSAPNTDAGFTQAVRQAYQDECAAISISWGAAEDNWSARARELFDAACADATSNGSVVCAASGDNLSADGLADGRPHVDFPAASPHVVGCGGTTKTAAGETVWNSGGGGTGGGYSAAFPTQAFQVGAPSKAGRMVPDVAGNADPATGWQVVVNGQVTVVGGTSAVAPMYAGLFAAIAAAAGKTGWATCCRPSTAGRPRLPTLLPATTASTGPKPGPTRVPGSGCRSGRPSWPSWSGPRRP